MKFEADAFISYAHLDNVELVEGRKGWVANLQRALAIRVAQLLGKESRIWWDKKLRGNDDFDDTLVTRLQRVALLVSVVSPRYVKSEWGRREILAFCKAAEEQGGLEIQDKVRLFKVLKTQVPLDEHPPELQPLLGYEFFKVEPDTGNARELNEIFGPEAQREFWLKLDDLAHDMCNLLQMLERGERQPAVAQPARRPSCSVYLAVATTDLREPREAMRRELEQQGYRVLPDRPLPLSADEADAAVRADLAQCRMSIHLVGKTYGLIPEGGTVSICEIQNELAIERGRTGGFSRIVWIPPGLAIEDERQRRAVEQLRNDARIIRGADVLEKPFEDLRTLVTTRLRQEEEPTPAAPGGEADAEGPPHVYLIHDMRDTDAIAPWADFLFNQAFEVIHPVFDGDEADVRAYHEENLKIADGIVIFYGAGNESWLRRKLREIQKSAGYGRTKPRPEVGICLGTPRTAEKERFRTHEALIIPQWDGLAADPWQMFVSRLKGGRSRRLDHAADASA